ncbi:hypothetical protein FHX74_001255 [Friedmanniella endophytica]|uniref:Uncharacterized protein n=1 Tax=Microlunatus kandeliicorticis TaxID=1759536 RepID=A0A7W3P597_9ACTN|nr:DUF6301 family protein [Microlunatus kandeliicorticis]MBA8793650.1 hypothetical protein [Microlunatus kandeliicorticis]
MAESAELGRFTELARWLASWSWPIEEKAAQTLVTDHGWALESETPGIAAHFRTGIIDHRDEASFLVDEGVLEELQFFTALHHDGGDEADKALTDALAVQVAAVIEVLGRPRRKKTGSRGSALWDLENGAMLSVSRARRSCAWTLTSPSYADVQRRLGG